MKKILIINANPNKNSLCAELAQSYKKGAEQSGATCTLVHLSDLKFNPLLTGGFKEEQALEPDLVTMQQEIAAADHLVFAYPTWWATYPALLKGFVDRVFLPGFAFKYREGSMLWDKLLAGKTAHLLVTMDAPVFYYKWFAKAPGHHSMKKGILEFCGVKPVKITSFGTVRASKEPTRNQWIAKAEMLGKNLK